jgi:hypothetical protein
VWKFVHAEDLTYKKTLIASERDRADVARRRMQWLKYRADVDPKRLVFIDETWVKTNMAPMRGWGKAIRRAIRATGAKLFLLPLLPRPEPDRDAVLKAETLAPRRARRDLLSRFAPPSRTS